jgi:hypothetical protein
MSQNIVVYKVYLSKKDKEGEIVETLESIDMARMSAEQTASVLVKTHKDWCRAKVLKCEMSNEEIKMQWEEWGEQDASNRQPQNDNVPLPFLKAYKRGYKKGKVD